VPDSELKTLLKRLHEELARGAALDGETRTLLDAVAADLRRSTASPSRLNTLAVRFELDHPELGAILRELADVLAKAGV
jgi:glutathione S-transferase